MTLDPSLAAEILSYLRHIDGKALGQAKADRLEEIAWMLHRVATGDETVDL